MAAVVDISSDEEHVVNLGTRSGTNNMKEKNEPETIDKRARKRISAKTNDHSFDDDDDSELDWDNKIGTTAYFAAAGLYDDYDDSTSYDHGNKRIRTNNVHATRNVLYYSKHCILKDERTNYGTKEDAKRISMQTKMVDIVNDDDDDCVVLDGDPDKHAQVENDLVDIVDESEELFVVGEKGKVACRDYPHPRHLCAKFPFTSTPHEMYCKQCHCYVCDSLAPCQYWGTGHCDVTEKLKSKSDQRNCWSNNHQCTIPVRESIRTRSTGITTTKAMEFGISDLSVQRKKRSVLRQIRRNTL